MRTARSAGACPLPAPQEHLCRFLRPWSPWPGRGGGAGRQDRDCGVARQGPPGGGGGASASQMAGRKRGWQKCSGQAEPGNGTAAPAAGQLAASVGAASLARGGRPPPRRCEGGWRWRGGGAARGGRGEEAAPAARGAAPRRRRLGRLIGPCPAGRRRDRGCRGDCFGGGVGGGGGGGGGGAWPEVIRTPPAR